MWWTWFFVFPFAIFRLWHNRRTYTQIYLSLPKSIVLPFSLGLLAVSVCAVTIFLPSCGAICRCVSVIRLCAHFHFQHMRIGPSIRHMHSSSPWQAICRFCYSCDSPRVCHRIERFLSDFQCWMAVSRSFISAWSKLNRNNCIWFGGLCLFFCCNSKQIMCRIFVYAHTVHLYRVHSRIKYNTLYW